MLPIILYSCCRKHCTIVANLTAYHLAEIIALLLADNTPEWMNLKDLQAYLPDHPAQTTVYGWIRGNSIPYYKTGKKLSFKKSEIDEWLNATRSKTDAEFEADAINYINRRRIGK